MAARAGNDLLGDEDATLALCDCYQGGTAASNDVVVVEHTIVAQSQKIKWSKFRRLWPVRKVGCALFHVMAETAGKVPWVDTTISPATNAVGLSFRQNKS